MKLTPLDLQHHTFRKSLQGLDPKQVAAFLELVRNDWEEMLRENHKLKVQVDDLNKKVLEYKEKEHTLQETLMMAQKLVEGMKKTSQKEADVLIGQAELQADKILHQAHERLTQIIDEINDLKKQRAEFEGKLKGILESHLRLIDLQKEAREKVHLEDVGLLPKAM
ncbi:MAG: DivIVA domain-containing protein [Pseudomonadota bacterium]